MASLRDLLNITGPDEIKGAAGAVKGSSEYFINNCYQICCRQGHGGCCLLWIVPQSASNAIIEVWGGGGGAAESCCCAAGTGGGSGSYSRKSVAVNPGDCYMMIAGHATTCSSNDDGCAGCYSCICGVGLSGTANELSICAQGGGRGCTCYHPRCNCIYSTPCIRSAFGGDINIDGVPGCYYSRCCSNWCWNKIFVAYPGGLINRCGGVVAFGLCDERDDNRFYMCWATNLLSGFGNTEAGYLPGIGGTTPVVQSGTCCCGSPGFAGMVKITYT